MKGNSKAINVERLNNFAAIEAKTSGSEGALKSLFDEACGMVEAAFKELREYGKGKTHPFKAGRRKRLGAACMVVDYAFGRLGILDWIHEEDPERKDAWSLYTSERRVLIHELQKRLDEVREEGLASKFGAFGYGLSAWGFYEGAIDLGILREKLSQVKNLYNNFRKGPSEA